MSYEWWRGACIYQIYPRSFLDSNNTGIGDLKGITSKLDYVASLGVDGIWISPFFTSPMKDFGYDVSDYRDIDPQFGTLADFDALLERAHSLGLKVIIDLVLSHTSDQHPWFSESPEYYVWADAKPDGTPPNNWVSVFGGSAWEWDETREKYYLHNFLKEQPDLNYHNPLVQDEALDICRFWLERGVDGFRLDVINFLFHDEALRDNPPRDPSLGAATQFEGDAPYSAQNHIYDKSRPEMLPFLKRLRGVMDAYEGRFTVGEIGDDHVIELAAAYTAPGLLDTTYNTDMMAGAHKDLNADIVRRPIEAFLAEGQGWPSWAFSNHDVVRVASRWHSGANGGDGFSQDPVLSKMLIALLGCLYGTVFLYQGEELGLPEAQLAFENLQDPWGIRLWPEWQGRDGCRTPMPWDENAKDGWLPVPDSHRTLNVSRQEVDADSPLNFVRSFLKWRKTQPCLLHGEIHFRDNENEHVLSFERVDGATRLGCLFNLSWQAQEMDERRLKPYAFEIEGFSF